MSVATNHDDGWRRRFVFGIAIMIAVNLLPLLATWGAYGTDGYECVGAPLHFLERGGFSYHVNFYPEWVLVDAAILLFAAYVFAAVSRGGFKACLHRLRTWGTPWA